MKITIIGAHNVGKTSLAEELLELLSGYTLESEPYYQLEEAGFEFSETPAADDFIKQFNYSVRLISNSEDNVIFDRSPLDLLAYLHVIDSGRNIQKLFETVPKVMAEMDLIVFVPVEEPDLITGSQNEHPELRSEVNELLYEWISDLGLGVVEVRGTLPERRKQVLAKISR